MIKYKKTWVILSSGLGLQKGISRKRYKSYNDLVEEK